MPLYVNCVVLRQKDSRWIISSTGKEVLCPREASSLSLSSATLTARSTGILVKSETTSKDTNSSQASRVLSLMKSVNSQEFFDSVISIPNNSRDRNLKPFYPKFLIGRHVAVVNENICCLRRLMIINNTNGNIFFKIKILYLL